MFPRTWMATWLSLVSHLPICYKLAHGTARRGYWKSYFRNTIRVVASLYPDLGLNCSQQTTLADEGSVSCVEQDLINSVARTLKKLRTSKGDYCIKQWFSKITSLFKVELLVKERICSQRGRSFSFKSSSLRYRNHFYHISWAPLSVTFLLRTWVYCVMGATPMLITIPFANCLLVMLNFTRSVNLPMLVLGEKRKLMSYFIKIQFLNSG